MPVVATFYNLLDSEIDLSDQPGGGRDRTLKQSVGVPLVAGEGAMVKWVTQRKATRSVTCAVTLNGILLDTYTITSADRFALTRPSIPNRSFRATTCRCSG